DPLLAHHRRDHGRRKRRRPGDASRRPAARRKELRPMLRLATIGMIWVGCLVAWTILGSSLVMRSEQSSGTLDREVRLLWGPPLEQRPPAASYVEWRLAATAPTTATTTATETQREAPSIERKDDKVARLIAHDVPVP